jgi:hypothetical protein
VRARTSDSAASAREATILFDRYLRYEHSFCPDFGL